MPLIITYTLIRLFSFPLPIIKVRRWFRKRREEMSQRIFTSCRKHFGQKDYSRDECLELIDSIPLDFNLIERIRIEANLEIANVDASTEFCQTKVPATSHLHVL